MASLDYRISTLMNFLQKLIMEYSQDGNPSKISSMTLDQRKRSDPNGFASYILKHKKLENKVEKIYDLTLYANAINYYRDDNIITTSAEDYKCEIIIWDDDNCGDKSDYIEIDQPVDHVLIIMIPMFYLDTTDRRYFVECKRYGQWFDFMQKISDIFLDTFRDSTWSEEGQIKLMEKDLFGLGFLKSCYVVDLVSLVNNIFAYIDHGINDEEDYYWFMRAMAIHISRAEIDWDNNSVATNVGQLMGPFLSGDIDTWNDIIRTVDEVIKAHPSPYDDCVDIVEGEEDTSCNE